MHCHRKERKIGLKTLDELKDMFSLFGLTVRISNGVRILNDKDCSVLSVTSEDGSVAWCEGWNKYDFPEKLQFPTYGTFKEEDIDFVVSSIVKSLETKKFLVWTTTNRGVVPFGSKVITSKTKIDLPDFSSVPELRVRMAVS